MSLFSKVQDKVYKEIDSIVGDDQVTAHHRPLLPYTVATLHEIWRCGPVGPLAAFRCPRYDTKVGKYTIFKGTKVHLNLYSMTKDPCLWGPDVDDFNPERFMDGNNFKNDWWDFTFGTGRRKCLGESVAKVENFLFFANMLKNFKLEVPEGDILPTTEPLDGMTIGPHHFNVKLTTR